MIKIALLIATSLLSLPAQAGGQQSHAVIHDKVAAFVQAQTQSLPGKVRIKVQDIDSRITLPDCPALEVFLPAGSQLQGNTTVGVRCPEGSGWSLFVQVSVLVSSPTLVTTHPLLLGQTVSSEDFRVQGSESPLAGALTDPAQAVGKVMKYGVGAGQVLRQDMLRAAFWVQQGKPVRMQVKGEGFSINTDGVALANASEGQMVQVKTSSGRVVTGVVRDEGLVEISP